MNEYRIVEITGNDGYPRIDGRYPLRIGRICEEPKPILGIPLIVRYLRERDGSDYSNRTLCTSRVINSDVLNSGERIIVKTINSRYVFDKCQEEKNDWTKELRDMLHYVVNNICKDLWRHGADFSVDQIEYLQHCNIRMGISVPDSVEQGW